MCVSIDTIALYVFKKDKGKITSKYSMIQHFAFFLLDLKYFAFHDTDVDI